MRTLGGRQTLDGRRGPYLPIDAVGAVLAPELREVLQAVPPVLAAARIELFVRILARLKQVQVLLNPCTRPSSRTELLMQPSKVRFSAHASTPCCWCTDYHHCMQAAGMAETCCSTQGKQEDGAGIPGRGGPCRGSCRPQRTTAPQ